MNEVTNIVELELILLHVKLVDENQNTCKEFLESENSDVDMKNV